MFYMWYRLSVIRDLRHTFNIPCLTFDVWNSIFGSLRFQYNAMINWYGNVITWLQWRHQTIRIDTIPCHTNTKLKKIILLLQSTVDVSSSINKWNIQMNKHINPSNFLLNYGRLKSWLSILRKLHLVLIEISRYTCSCYCFLDDPTSFSSSPDSQEKNIMFLGNPTEM